jgi:molybdopterin-guanine dinucleotide biosynthesis protein A
MAFRCVKSGVILAGGKSSRFGKDKALIQFQGKPLVEWVMEAIDKVVDEVILSLSSGPENSNFVRGLGKNVRIVMDAKPGLGPISGLCSSFKEAKEDYVAVAPCDSPFIKPELYTLLFKKAEGHDGAVPFINNFWEPLHAVYRRKPFIVGLEKALSAGKTRPVDTYPYLNIKKVRQEEVEAVDAEALSFININTMDDLLKAKKIMKNR